MMSRKDITKIAKRIIGANTGLQSPQLMHPRRDWVIGLGVAFAIFAASAVWSTHAYLKHKDPNVGVTESPTDELVVYRASLIQAALAEFAERTETYEALIAAERVAGEVETEEASATSTPAAEPPVSEREASGATTTESAGAAPTTTPPTGS